MVAPIIAAKAAGGVSKALSGDIWSRTTTREVGKGKDKRMVESTVRINTGTALMGAGAVAITAVGLGVTAFMLGVKALPVSRQVTYGKWVWPGGGDASKIMLSTIAGSAPKRDTGTVEAVLDYIQPGFYRNDAVIGARCLTDGSEFIAYYTGDWEGLDRWYLLHKGHIIEKVYSQVWVEPLEIMKSVPVYEYAVWTVTETKDKLGFDIATRPTLSEGLTGVVSMVSVPFQLATNPLAPVSDGIQAIKDIFHLP